METAKEGRSKKNGLGVGETKKWTYSDAVERREPEKKKKKRRSGGRGPFVFFFRRLDISPNPLPPFPRKGRRIGGKEEEKGVSDGTRNALKKDSWNPTPP